MPSISVMVTVVAVEEVDVLQDTGSQVVLLLENVVDVDDVVEVIVELTEVEVVDETDVVDVKVLPSSRISKVGQIVNYTPINHAVMVLDVVDVVDEVDVDVEDVTVVEDVVVLVIVAEVLLVTLVDDDVDVLVDVVSVDVADVVDEVDVVMEVDVIVTVDSETVLVDVTVVLEVVVEDDDVTEVVLTVLVVDDVVPLLSTAISVNHRAVPWVEASVVVDVADDDVEVSEVLVVVVLLEEVVEMEVLVVRVEEVLDVVAVVVVVTLVLVVEVELDVKVVLDCQGKRQVTLTVEVAEVVVAVTDDVEVEDCFVVELLFTTAGLSYYRKETVIDVAVDEVSETVTVTLSFLVESVCKLQDRPGFVEDLVMLVVEVDEMDKLVVVLVMSGYRDAWLKGDFSVSPPAGTEGRGQSALLQEPGFAWPAHVDVSLRVQTLCQQAAWKEESYGYGQQPYSGRSRGQPDWNDWQPKGKGKKSGKEAAPEQAGHQFPSYEMIPVKQGKGGKDARKPASHYEQEVVNALPDNSGGLAKYVQKMVNALRKADGKLRRCDADQQEAEEQWDSYRKGLQQSFMKERQRYRDRVVRVQEERTECAQMKEEALQALRDLIVDPSGTMKPPVSAPAVDSEAAAEWDELMTGTEDPWAALPDLITGAQEAGGLPPATRQKLLGALGLAVPEKAAKTPPRKPHQPPSFSPPGKGLLSSPTFGEEGTYSAADVSAASDPYLTSPGNKVTPLTTMRTRSRSQSGAPRVSVKQHLTGPVKTTRPGALADKLEERRATAMQEENQGPLDVDEESEEDLISDLKGIHDGFFGVSIVGMPGWQQMLANQYEAHWWWKPNVYNSFGGSRCEIVAESMNLCGRGGPLLSTGLWQCKWDLGSQDRVHDQERHGPPGGHDRFYVRKIFDVFDILEAFYGDALQQFLAWAIWQQVNMAFGLDLQSSLHGGGNVSAAETCWSCSCGCYLGEESYHGYNFRCRIMAGQRSRREQFAEAEARLVAQRPLEHLSREAPPVRYEMSLEEPQPDPEAAEVADVHVTLWVASPFYEAEIVDIEVRLPTTTARLGQALKDSCSVMPDYATEFVCTTPQVGREFASFVAIPPWIRESDKTVVVLDCSAIDGGIFATYVNGDITKENVMMCLVIGQPDGLAAYAFGSDRRMRSRQIYQRVQGGVIKIVRDGMDPRWTDDIEPRLVEPRRWNPNAALPDPVAGLHTVYQSADDQVVQEIASDDERTLEVSAEEALNYEHGEVWIVVPEDRLTHLSHLGRRIWGQIAVLDGVEQMAPESLVIFLDLRGLAHFPQWAQIAGDRFSPMSYYEGLQVGAPDGWQLMVKSGETIDDTTELRVRNGEVLEMFLVLASEADLSMTDGTLDMDEDDESSCDALPDSSDLSSPSPHPPGAPPNGPPPPQPVNRPRSRSPRTGRGRQSHPATLCLADCVSRQQFDLTVSRLCLPHTSHELWGLCKPWPGDWLEWSMDKVELNAEAKKVVEAAPAWPSLLKAKPTGPIQLHVYTDGSACERTGRSGYAVVMLLKIGAVCAVFGVLGGPLEGAACTDWPVEQPPALHAEQVAVAAALLWLLQLRCFIPQIEAQIFVDCLAAGRAATGQWAPPNELAMHSHNLELILREIDGVHLRIQHIKGHAGHGWNETADAVAKAAAKGDCTFAEPPSSTIQTFLTANLDWISFDIAARRTGSSLVEGDCMCWPEQFHTDFRLQPQQLVPTVDEAGGRPAEDSTEFEMLACSFNVQGLGGSHRYMEEQFDFYGYNVVFLQETKSSDGQCLSKRFYRLMSPSERYWGVAVWVNRQSGLMTINGQKVLPKEEDISVVFQGPRLLAVQISVKGLRIGLISGHCPHAGRAMERDQFVTDLKGVLCRMKKWSLVVIGMDANARLPLNVMHVTGDLEFDDPDANGTILAEVCRELGLWVPATFGHLHQGESSTYTHCTGMESRIDYLFLGGGADILGCRSAVNAALDNGSPNLDHKAVTVRLVGRLGKAKARARLKRIKFDTEAMATDAGRDAVEQMCAQFEQPRWEVSPDEHCSLLETHLQQFMSAQFPKADALARASYIPEEVWRLRQLKNQLKWRTRARLLGWRSLLPAALLCWRAGPDTTVLLAVRRQSVLYQVVACAIKFVTLRMRRLISEAKDGFLRRVATEGDQGVCAILHRAKRAGIGARAKAPVRREMPKLLDPMTGCEAATAADRDGIWLRFFGEQEAGTVVKTSAFIEDASAGTVEDSPAWDWQLLPNRLEIEAALRRLPKNKAAGLDQVPSDLLRVSPSCFAALLQPLFVKALVLGRQPLQWRGGVLFEMFKQSGSPAEVANHRSIYISSFIAKALHRVMRDKVKDETGAFLHPLHCGTRPGLPVLFPSLFVLEHLRKCQQRGLCAAMLFIDTKAAYYRLVRQLATGDLRVDKKVVELFFRFGLDGQDIEALSELILNGGMFKAADIPDPIRSAVADFHKATWFTTRYTDGHTLCHATAGSRPGASWADCVFAFIYARILYHVHEMMEGEGINFDLPLDESTGVFKPAGELSRHPAWDTTWADDSAYALQADNAEQMLQKTGRVGALVLTAFRSHGLDPNLKRHKTSAMLSLKGKGSTKIRKQCFANGKPELFLPDLQEAIPIVPHYKHLGCMVDPVARLNQEARHRTALAATAYDSAKDLLLQNRDLALSTRVALFRTTVVASYFNLEVWLAVGQAWDAMSDAFSRLVRRLLCRLVPDKEVYKIPTPLAHIITGCWPLEQFARRDRISALVSLAATGPPILWAAIQAAGQWADQLCDDLHWLVQGDLQGWPSVCAAAWPQWWHLLREHPARVKRRAAKRNEETFEHYKTQATIELCLWYLYRSLRPDPDSTEVCGSWWCRMCDKMFRSKANLSVHLFKVHGRCAEYRRYIQSTACGACGKEFWTYGRVEDHLRSSSKCVRQLQRRLRPSKVLMPGYGSKRRRQREAETFTPAPPSAATAEVQWEEQPWSIWQRQLHEDLCDTVLDVSPGQSIADALWRKVCKYPLYTQEIQQVVHYLFEEIELVANDRDLQQWTESQVEDLCSALQQILDRKPPHADEIQRGSPTLQSRARFTKSVRAFDWGEAISRQRASYGTRASTLFILTDDWEVVWSQNRGVVSHTTVIRDPLKFLPETLCQLWEDFLNEGSPLLEAPQSFWRHPLAVAFVPFRVLCAGN
ncbi:Pol [Symbiodinium sp. CCMP2592]|nr:Pol [Symbiodinium sp. CCMP2592]